MINIVSKRKCCGCSACIQICQKNCISFLEDDEGFSYPHINNDLCINCNLCESVCPYLNPKEKSVPILSLAFQCKNDELRKKSSSGGIFTLLSEEIIKKGGCVFGAEFNKEWEVEHNYAETIEDLSAFRGAKYSQSLIGNNYQKVKQFLKKGRIVLFSGSPCQVAGLKKYLKKEYDNLITVDTICHAIPSPLVWRKYLSETIASLSYRREDISNINFRSKTTGWKKYSFEITFKDGFIYSEPHSDNPYMNAFLADLSVRPSCFDCPAKAGKSGSDITIGDYWGFDQQFPKKDDDKGTSLVIINTNKGIDLLKQVTSDYINVSLKQATRNNSAYWTSPKETTLRKIFFESIKYKTISKTSSYLLRKSIQQITKTIVKKNCNRLKKLICIIYKLKK